MSKLRKSLFDKVAEFGGKPVMGKTGHSLIKVKMAETNSPLAGEMSGHIFFADKYYGFDDAIYAAVRLVSLISASGKSLGRNGATPCRNMINTPELRFPVDEARKFAVVDEVKARLQKGERQSQRYRRRARVDGGWLVAFARVEHASGSGRPRRSADRRRA